MSVGPIQLRDKVLRNISAQAEAGACWLEALPSLLGRLETEWNIQVGRLFPNATEAFVSEAVTADGQLVALKIPIPGLVKADREGSLLETASAAESGFCATTRITGRCCSSGLVRSWRHLVFQSKTKSGSSAGHCSRPGGRCRPA